MGISLYYSAARARKITASERTRTNALIESFTADALKHVKKNARPWESFGVYAKKTEPGVIFEGATGLPMESPKAFTTALTHWTKLLAQLRPLLPGAEWTVNVDEQDLVWDEKQQSYDVSDD